MKAHLKKREIGDRVIVVEFEVDKGFTFQPGEYTQVILGEDKALRHYFSVASSPTERGIIRIATRPSESLFKKTLQEMPLGTKVEVKGPWGDLLLPRDQTVPLVFIAGGIGITPFVSMLSYIAENNLPYKITLLYFTRDRLFEDDLRRMVGDIGGAELIISEESINSPRSPLYQRGDGGVMYYLAGPPGFVNQAIFCLQESGIDQRHIVFESYTGY